MFKYFQTTTLILLWCLLISLLWSFAVYYWESRRKSAPKEGVPGKVLLPALVLAPACLTLGFRFFGLNLLFPLHFFASLPRIAAAALVPALVLLLASGLMGNIARSIRFEYAHWSQKVFATVAKSLGEELAIEIEKISTGREKLSKLIKKGASKQLITLGIELIDVQLRGISYIRSVEAKVFERMISERQRIAERIRSVGKGEEAKIRGTLNKDLKGIESEAYRKSQSIKGKAEGESIQIYAKSLKADPKYYEFTRTLEAYKKSLTKGSFILSTDSDFLKLLQKRL